MNEIIRFKIIDSEGRDSEAELVVDTDTDIFGISIVREEVMSGMWSSNLQKVFQRALEMWKVEPIIEEIQKMKDKKDIEEFKENGYTIEEIEKMSDDEFIYTAVALVDGKSKEEIDRELGKEKNKK